jgi:hypothetical protein
MLVVTTFLELRVVAGRSRTRAGRPHAVSGRPMLTHTYHAVSLPWPCRGLERSLSERHIRGMAGERHGMFESVLRYPARNTHKPCRLPWPAPLFFIRMRQVAICGLPRSTIFFPHYHINGTIFGKTLQNIKYVLWFSVQLWSETFLILSRTERDMIKYIYIYRSSYKVPVIVRFQLTLHFLRTWGGVLLKALRY